MGTEKIVGRGRRKSVTRWGVKISPQGGGQFEEQGGGREGELSEKMPENNDFGQKITTFLCHKEKNENFLENVQKSQFFPLREGV